MDEILRRFHSALLGAAQNAFVRATDGTGPAQKAPSPLPSREKEGGKPVATTDAKSLLDRRSFLGLGDARVAALAIEGRPTGMGRRLRWVGCLNARDLGGYPTADGRRTCWGAIVRSEQLSRLTETGRAAVIGYGIRTIVDLRRPGEEVALLPSPFARPGSHGVAYANVPFERPPASTEAIAEAVISGDRSLTDLYRWMLDRYRSGVAGAMRAIAKARAGGVLVHCMWGRDRTGLVSALLLDLVGVDRESIGADYALSTECLRPLTEEWLANGAGERTERERTLERLDTRAEVVLGALQYLDERYGSPEAYLLEAGLAPEDVALLRERLLPPCPTQARP
jgi:protein tyrosine/serine phosphatase